MAANAVDVNYVVSLWISLRSSGDSRARKAVRGDGRQDPVS